MKEKVKKFWEEFKQHWLWINIGGYMGITMMNWLGYFPGFISLEITFIFTFILPPILISIYYTRKSCNLGCAIGTSLICTAVCASPCSNPFTVLACIACVVACAAIAFTLCTLIGIYGCSPGCEWLCCQG